MAKRVVCHVFVECFYGVEKNIVKKFKNLCFKNQIGKINFSTKKFCCQIQYKNLNWRLFAYKNTLQKLQKYISKITQIKNHINFHL